MQAYNNQVIDTTNYGIAITAGHDSSFYNNRIISAGVLADGTPIAAQNTGAAIWDSNNDRLLSPATWFNDSGSGNQIGWMLGTVRNDWWTPNAASWTNNTHWPGTTITLATQNAEFGVWRAKLAGVAGVIGPARFDHTRPRTLRPWRRDCLWQECTTVACVNSFTVHRDIASRTVGIQVAFATASHL